MVWLARGSGLESFLELGFEKTRVFPARIVLARLLLATQDRNPRRVSAAQKETGMALFVQKEREMGIEC